MGTYFAIMSYLRNRKIGPSRLSYIENKLSILVNNGNKSTFATIIGIPKNLFSALYPM